MRFLMPWNDRVKRRLKLRDLDILMAVIEAGSMGKAAIRLNISQPAVSKAIVELEDALGVQLFDRGSNGQGEIRARVAVGDRVDVEVVDAPAFAYEREQRAARKLSRSFDVGHAVH